MCLMFFFSPFLTFHVPGVHSTCHIAVRYEDSGRTLYFDTLSLWSRLPSGNSFRGKSTGKRGTRQIMALGIPLNPLYDLLYFVVFFSLHVAPHFHCIVCPWTRPAKIALLGVLSNLPDTIFLRSGITARVQNSLFGGVDA
jgi:hypothetical protein